MACCRGIASFRCEPGAWWHTGDTLMGKVCSACMRVLFRGFQVRRPDRGCGGGANLRSRQPQQRHRQHCCNRRRVCVACAGSERVVRGIQQKCLRRASPSSDGISSLIPLLSPPLSLSLSLSSSRYLSAEATLDARGQFGMLCVHTILCDLVSCE